jgi:serine protease Do
LHRPSALARRAPSFAIATPVLVANLLLPLGCLPDTGEGAPAETTGIEVAADADWRGAGLASLLPVREGGQAAPPGAAEVSQSLGDSRTTAVVTAAARVSPSVVAVNVIRTEQVRMQDPFWDDFFFFGPSAGRTAVRRVPSLGSGFIVDPSGVILTNDHVVRGAERIRVSLPDGREAEAQLLGTDEATDVAVLRISLENLPLAPIGRSEDLRIGEWAVAFGNPFGNLLSNPEPTVTVGVVSAVGRHIVASSGTRGFYLGMIQTDAAINPGNSGGPLVNALGEVIGMNASIFSRGGGSEGLGFAIPIERVLRIADDLIREGRVRRAWSGIEVEPVEADEFGRTRGVRVSRVISGSPAQRAGVREADRILELNDRRLTTPLDFEAVLLDLRAGDFLQVQVEGRSSPLRLQAEETPSQLAARVTVLQDLQVVTLTPAIREERGVASEQGALVVALATATQQALGLRPGDVVVGLNNRPVRGAQDLAEALRQIPAGSRVRLYFERNRGIVARDFLLGR